MDTDQIRIDPDTSDYYVTSSYRKSLEGKGPYKSNSYERNFTSEQLGYPSRYKCGGCLEPRDRLDYDVRPPAFRGTFDEKERRVIATSNATDPTRLSYYHPLSCKQSGGFYPTDSNYYSRHGEITTNQMKFLPENAGKCSVNTTPALIKKEQLTDGAGDQELHYTITITQHTMIFVFFMFIVFLFLCMAGIRAIADLKVYISTMFASQTTSSN